MALRTSSRPRLVRMLALALIPAAAHGDDAPAHRGMLRSGEPRTMPIYDPWYVNTQLNYSLVGGQYVVVDGDLVLGTETEVLARSWALAVRTAKRVVDGKTRAGLPFIDTLDLQPQEKNDIREFAGRNPDVFPARDVAEAKKKVENAIEVLDPLLRLRAPGGAGEPVQHHASVVLAGVRGKYLWPGGKIPFEMAVVPAHETLIRAAMAHWTEKTKGRITFVVRDKAAKDFVRFEDGDGCGSQWVGRMEGMQLVLVSDGCELQQLIHELGHVVGLFHEQNRLKRDEKIQLLEENVKLDYVSQFKRSFRLREDQARNVGEFDWKSIMLYPPRAFTKNGKQTLRRLGRAGDRAWGLKVDKEQGGVIVELERRGCGGRRGAVQGSERPIDGPPSDRSSAETLGLGS